MELGQFTIMNWPVLRSFALVLIVHIVLPRKKQKSICVSVAEQLNPKMFLMPNRNYGVWEIEDSNQHQLHPSWTPPTKTGEARAITIACGYLIGPAILGFLDEPTFLGPSRMMDPPRFWCFCFTAYRYHVLCIVLFLHVFGSTKLTFLYVFCITTLDSIRL